MLDVKVPVIKRRKQPLLKIDIIKKLLTILTSTSIELSKRKVHSSINKQKEKKHVGGSQVVRN